MASFGKVLDLLDDRYLELQDVIGSVEPLPTLVPYAEYTQHVIVYRMDTNHEVFLGLIQDFTMRRAHETGKELWTWFVQWEVDNNPPTQQPSSSKKVRMEPQPVPTLSIAPATPRQTPALTIFERRTLDGALMLEEDMLRILIDIVQVASSLVPNFIEFLYRWIDYYEGDGKALKAALRWEIPSLWDFEYHPLVLPPDTKKENEVAGSENLENDGYRERSPRSRAHSQAAELRQSSPTKKMHTQPKPDLAALELQIFYTEESERLQYREVKFGIQPPKLKQPLPPLINIPRDQRKRTKYYAACFKSRQRALYLLLEAGVTMRQINNYQKLQTAHPKETSEGGDGNGLRNYQKDAKYAQAQFELKEKQMKQREIAISNKLAVEAQLAATHAIPDGAAGLPLIPPTPSYARKPDMAAAMMQRINETKASKEKDEKINFVPKPLVGRLKSKIFENAMEEPSLKPIRDSMAEGGWYARKRSPVEANNGWNDLRAELDEEQSEEEENNDDDDVDDGANEHNNVGTHSDENKCENAIASAATTTALDLPRPSLPPLLPPPPQPLTASTSTTRILDGSMAIEEGSAMATHIPIVTPPHNTPPDIATYMQNLNTEQARNLLTLLSPEARHAAVSRLQASIQGERAAPSQSVPWLDRPAPSNHAQRPSIPISQSSQDDTFSVSPVTSNQTQTKDHAIIKPPDEGAAISSTQPTSGGSRNIPYTLLATSVASTPDNNPPVSSATGFSVEHFMYLRRQQAASTTETGTSAQSSRSALPSTPVALQPQPIADPDFGKILPMQRQRVLSADFAAMNALARADSHTQPEAAPSHVQQFASSSDLTHQKIRMTEPPPSTLLQPQQQLHPHIMHPMQIPQTASEGTHTAPTTSVTPSVYLPTSTAMLPPPRPGITRNAPSPLSLSPPKPSPFTTLAPQILATSPFLGLSRKAETPIQIYLPKILVPGNGIGPGGRKMGDGGCIETDALMLGYEKPSGELVLNKALLLPVGVWENTLRKVRSGRWSVLETYACPASRLAKAKGKEKASEAPEKGCHAAVYDKLAHAYGMLATAPTLREEQLTKRWRVSRGPMTSHDRGAVWEGWAAYVDRDVAMTAAERIDALKSDAARAVKVDDGGVGDRYGPYGDFGETARRRKEMEELMDEDEDMED